MRKLRWLFLAAAVAVTLFQAAPEAQAYPPVYCWQEGGCTICCEEGAPCCSVICPTYDDRICW